MLQDWQESVLGTFLSMVAKLDAEGRAEIALRLRPLMDLDTPSDLVPIDGTYVSHEQEHGGEA